MTFEPRFTLTPRLQRQLVAIERTCGFLEAVRLRPDWLHEVRETVQVQDALSSVQIEGNSLTLEEAYALARQVPTRRLRDAEREFLNYLGAFEAIDALRGARDYPVRLSDLLNLHQTIVEGVRGGDRYAGQIRREEVKVGDIIGDEQIIHHSPPPWTEVEPLLRELFDWAERAKQKPRPGQVERGAEDPWVHPVLVAGIVQHRLVWIHPFVDGNGRTARMMSTMLLFQRRYDFKYLFDLSSYYNRNRDKYYDALRTADIDGDYTRWLEYFVGGFALQMYGIGVKAREAAVGLEVPENEE